MRHLLQSWGEVAPRLSRASKIALFLDFDGTLAPIRPTPQEVTFQAPLKKALAELSDSPRFFIWIISGRRRSDIRERIGLRGVRYLGLHGWEGRCLEPLAEASSMALAGVKSWAGGLFANSSNVWIEDKGLSVAIHHHETSPPGPPVETMLESMVEPFKDVLRIARAKNVHEVLPLELQDKGAAVKHQMAAVCNQALPIYVGDDSIDEPAFVALRRGLTVRVGRVRRSKARYRLSDVGEVQQFLERLGTEFA
jgi:trehalose 6-phosphate phosphatase